MVLSGFLRLLFETWLLVSRVVTRSPRMLFNPAVVLPALTLTELLYPRLVVEDATGGTGTEEVVLHGASDFYSKYALSGDDFLLPNPVYNEADANIYSAPVNAPYDALVNTMASKIVAWQYIPAEGPYLYLWNSSNGVKTVTFVDVNGNEAWTSPLVVVLFAGTITIANVEYYVAAITATLVSSDGYTAKVRLTRSHPATYYINTTPPDGHLEMKWTYDAVDCVADPADPTNVDKCVVTLGAGKWLFGVKTTYYNDDTGKQYICYSEQTLLVEIN